MKHLSKLLALSFCLLFLLPAQAVAQELYDDFRGVWKARVIEVTNEREEQLPFTDATNVIQTLQAEILDGELAGQTVEFDNDFIILEEGDKFYLHHSVDINGGNIFAVQEIDRGSPLLLLTILFVAVIVAFAGKQGLRSLLSLALSLMAIIFVLIPLLKSGYPPIISSILVSIIVLAAAIFITHGPNRSTLAAFLGTVSAVVITGLLAYATICITQLTGFASDEAVYLNLGTGGQLDFVGLLLAAIIIGSLGVLDDIAITQTASVREISAANPNLSKKELYNKALSVGKDHVGALVNTLFLAYTGATLPLLLLFSQSESSFISIANREVFATEIVRTLVGSIGLVLTVPITTLLAVHLIKGKQ